MKAVLIAWLERRWYGGHAPEWPLRLLARLYARLVRRRRGRFIAGSGPQRVALPVVVVGNLVVGGAGKTPLTLALVEGLRARGWHPGVISRGYGGRARGAHLVDIDADADQVGDEPLLLAASGAPVAVARHRIEAARLLIARGGVDLLIADDGLQHHGLARDVEIAVIDGSRGLGNGHLLPAGPLREPASRLLDCDFVVRNGGEAGAGEIPMQLLPVDARRLQDGVPRPLSEFAGGPVHAVAGIGHPERFFAMLRDAGLTLHTHPFPDHHRFTARDLDFGDALVCLMTSKDAVKCRALNDPRLWEVPVRAHLPETFLDTLDQRLRQIPDSSGKPA